MTHEESALNDLRAGDLFGGLVFRWDPTQGVFVDQGGIPLSKTATKALLGLIRIHLSKSPTSLAKFADKALATQMPSRKIHSPFNPKRFE